MQKSVFIGLELFISALLYKNLLNSFTCFRCILSPMKSPVWLCPLAAFRYSTFFLRNVGVSLLENASHLGLPVPEKLKAVLSQLHNKDDKEEQ